MLFKRAPRRLVAGLAAALVGTPALAIDTTKLQSIRSSLSVEEIVAFAMAKSTAPILDIDKPVDVNIIINVKGMERSDIQALQLERDCFSRNRNRDSLSGANQIHHSGGCRRPVWMAKPFSDDLR
ncbi:hypothetical protein ACIPSK_23075, partial [Rhizobium sp. LARHSG275]